MKYTIIPGQQADYQVTVELQANELQTYQQQAIKKLSKDIEVPGFRKGHVPEHIALKNIKPEYLNIAIYEEIINTSMKRVINDNKNIMFIGEIYDLHINNGMDKQQDASQQDDTNDQPSEKNNDNPTTNTASDEAAQSDEIVIVYRVDSYPDVDIKNDNRKATPLQPINQPITDEEIQNTYASLQQQHASYEDSETLDEETFIRVMREYRDAEANVLDKVSRLIAVEDFTNHPELRTFFFGKTVGDTIEAPYDTAELPEFFHTSKEIDPKSIAITITEMKKTVLPEFNDENVADYFPDMIKTRAELDQKIVDVLTEEKRKKEIIDAIEDFLAKNADTFHVRIPQTILKDEIQGRMKSLKERLGGEDAYTKYRESMPQEAEKMDEQISNAAEISLQKFFILKKIAEDLGVRDQIDLQKDLHMEQTIYTALSTSQETS